MNAPTPIWSDRLAFDVALMLEGSGEQLEEVLQRYSVSSKKLEQFNKDPTFLRRVADYRAEITEKGLTFRLKARAQAEELLHTSWALIHHPDVSPAVKADLIKSTVKWGGLDNSVLGAGLEGGGGVKITINFANTPDPSAETPQKTPKSSKNPFVRASQPLPLVLDADFTLSSVPEGDTATLTTVDDPGYDADALLERLDALVSADPAVSADAQGEAGAVSEHPVRLPDPG